MLSSSAARIDPSGSMNSVTCSPTRTVAVVRAPTCDTTTSVPASHRLEAIAEMSICESISLSASAMISVIVCSDASVGVNANSLTLTSLPSWMIQ